MPSDFSHGCLIRTASSESRVANVSTFIVEELGDARVRCEQLKGYVDEATKLIEKSPARDHVFEVAGHLMHGIPEVLFKLEKALEAASMGASRMDYDQLSERVKPEKVEELERALSDSRLRKLRRSEGEEPRGKEGSMLNPKIAANELHQIAQHVEVTGNVPIGKLVSLISQLEAGKREASASPQKVAGYLHALADNLLTTGEDSDPSNRPSRFTLAQHLRRVVGDQIQMPMTSGQQQVSAQEVAQIYQRSNSREEVMKGFKDANPAMSEEDLSKAADMWEKHRNVVKDQNK